MTDRRFAALAAVSAAALLAGAAHAQTPPEAPVADTGAPGSEEAAEVEEIVVTGTRAPGRTRLETVSPVDVISEEALARQGTSTELAQALSSLAPAINFPRPAITDGTDHIRPATLRGLAPDQTLVLVNGIRGHSSALVNVNGSIGRGSTAFDLNTVPTLALGQVEVLRDGASAQYGSDAIAGVINLRLREEREGGEATYNYGIYDTEVETFRNTRDADDGLTQSLAAWQGLPLGEEGFLTVTGEYVNRHPTNRSDAVNTAAVPLYAPGTVIGRFGDPRIESLTFFANAGAPLGGRFELYGYAGYQTKDGEAAATARAYNNANNVPALYPGGFLPFITTEIEDVTLAGGIRGDVAGWTLDASLAYGSNDLRYGLTNTLNATYGAGSQTSFDAGGLFYDQFLLGVDASRAFDVGLAEPLNVAVGVEYRDEGFEITPGEPASYSNGGVLPTRAPVSQGFGGFRPSNAIDTSRDSIGAYVDVEGNLTERLTFGLAGRYEDYSDFGDTLNGKLSARYEFTPDLALRGTVSTGFKAPALQQQFFTYTATNAVVVGGSVQLIEVGTFPVNSPVARAIGSQPLEPEESTNYSLGLVYSAGPFELTVDAYRIEIDNRIVLSENLPNNNTPAATATAITDLLQPFGVSAARFFINGVDTVTEGLDVVARYRLDAEDAGRFDFTLAANLNTTDVTRTPDLPTITTLPSPAFLFDRSNVLTFEEGTPEQKLVFNTDWEGDSFGATLKSTFYDSVLVPNNTPSFDYETGDAVLWDVEGRYRAPFGVGLALGVQNLFDVYPQYTPGALNSPTGSVGFPGYSPFGFNGRFLYARLSYEW